MTNIFDGKHGQPRIYDGNSYAEMKDSLISQVANKSIFKRNGLPVTDAGVSNMGSYLEYQLTYVVPQVLTRKYPDQPALDLFSVSNEGTLEKVILRRMKTFSGLHTRSHENKDNPAKGVISVSYAANGMRVEDFEASSHYKEKDLLRAAQMNDPLDASIIAAHDESYKRVINGVAFLGMTDEQGNTLVEGLLNNSQVDASVSLNATYAFNNASATGYRMYEDIAGLWRALCALAGGNASMFPDTIVTSPRVLATLYTVTYGSGISQATQVNNVVTIAQLIKSMLGITEIRSCVQAVNLDGTGTTDRLCMFKRSPEEMVLHIPKPLTFSEVFKKGFSYEIQSQFFVAGLNIFRNTTFGYLKGC
jgi:hypothetical protein